jgi:hypothetical protein
LSEASIFHASRGLISAIICSDILFFRFWLS